MIFWVAKYYSFCCKNWNWLFASINYLGLLRTLLKHPFYLSGRSAFSIPLSFYFYFFPICVVLFCFMLFFPFNFYNFYLFLLLVYLSVRRVSAPTNIFFCVCPYFNVYLHLLGGTSCTCLLVYMSKSIHLFVRDSVQTCSRLGYFIPSVVPYTLRYSYHSRHSSSKTYFLSLYSNFLFSLTFFFLLYLLHLLLLLFFLSFFCFLSFCVVFKYYKEVGYTKAAYLQNYLRLSN